MFDVVAYPTALAAIVLAIATAPAGAQKDLVSCKPVFDATAKQMKVDSHAYSPADANVSGGSKSEIIFVGGVTYVNAGGHWSRSPMTPAALEKTQAENIKSATAYSCKHLRDEVLGGAPTAVYESTGENEGITFHSQIWIAKGSGLPLRNETDMDIHDGTPKLHRSTRYEYSNVKLPRGVK
jgi:hypothetical protein